MSDAELRANNLVMTRALFEDYKRMFRKQGATAEQERILRNLTNYLELTQFSETVEGAEPDYAWSAGYQTAMAIVRAENK